MRKPADRYGTIAMTLHWVIVALIAATFVLAWVLPRRSAPGYEGWLSLHKSVGLMVLVLALGRLAWRRVNPVALARGLAPIEVKLSHVTHLLLYAILIIIPVSGYLFSSWDGEGVTLFGLVHLGTPFTTDRGLARPWELAHRLGQYVVYAIVGLHVLAALYHYFVKRDQVLQRMLPPAWGARLRR